MTEAGGLVAVAVAVAAAAAAAAATVYHTVALY